MPAIDQEVDADAQISSSHDSVSSSGGTTLNTKYDTKGLYERMLYLPDGPNGAVLRFEQRQDIDGETKLCSWLQDGNANYYYHSGEKKIYITNDPLRMLVMPTDKPELADFIYSHAGHDSRLSYERRFLSGLVRQSVDNRVAEYAGTTFKYSYNDVELSDLYKNWPSDCETIDQRDEMHKRGWAYFKITGHIHDRKVTGYGKIPLVYNASVKHKPWLNLQIGEGRYLELPGERALAESNDSSVRYESGAFFEGLARPWEGIACVDSVRRDAAKYKIPFDTRLDDEKGYVKLNCTGKDGKFEIRYDIDLSNDLIHSIVFVNGGVFGALCFTYEQGPDMPDDNYSMPAAVNLSCKKAKPRKLWLTQLP